MHPKQKYKCLPNSIHKDDRNAPGYRCSCLTKPSDGDGFLSSKTVSESQCKLRGVQAMTDLDVDVAAAIYQNCGKLPGDEDFTKYKQACRKRTPYIRIYTPYANKNQWGWFNRGKKIEKDKDW